jgi:hypothetical protein
MVMHKEMGLIATKYAETFHDIEMLTTSDMERFDVEEAKQIIVKATAEINRRKRARS